MTSIRTTTFAEVDLVFRIALKRRARGLAGRRRWHGRREGGIVRPRRFRAEKRKVRRKNWREFWWAYFHETGFLT